MPAHLLPRDLAERQGPLRPLALLLHGLDLVACWAIIVAVVVMVAVVSLQVLLRYVFNSSLGFADELSRLTFVWTMFLGIPLAVRLGGHIGMELLTARLPAQAQAVLVRTMAALGAAMMALVAWQAVVVARDQWDELMASIDASAAWFIVAVAVGCAHSALHMLWITLAGKAQGLAPMGTE